MLQLQEMYRRRRQFVSLLDSSGLLPFSINRRSLEGGARRWRRSLVGAEASWPCQMSFLFSFFFFSCLFIYLFILVFPRNKTKKLSMDKTKWREK